MDITLEKNWVYVVTMYRWGNYENHSYVLGVFDTNIKAKNAGKREEKFRGGKYFYESLLVFIGKKYPSTGWEKMNEIKNVHNDY
jgi:hypothetical protein